MGARSRTRRTSPRTKLRLRLLGGFEAHSGETPVTVPLQKARALLAYLALQRGAAVPRRTLATLLWPERPETQALNSLRQALFALRRSLPAAARAHLVVGAASVALDVRSIDVDVDRFDRLAREGSPAALRDAIRLYTGDLLAGFAVDDSDFDEWLRAEQDRLRARALTALEEVLADQVKQHDVEAAIGTAGRLVTLDPLRETAHRTLMRLHADAGRSAMALRQYQRCAEVLQRELHVEPEPDTRALYRELLQQRSAASLESLSSAAAPHGPMIGRERQLAILMEAVARARGSRPCAVAVLGEAGVGKTRLVTELARQASEADWFTLTGRCFETERILPLGPWIEVLRAATVAAPGRLARLPKHFRHELAPMLPEVSGERAPASRDTRRLFEAVAAVLHLLAETAPVLVVLEDAHAADDMSLRLFTFLARQAGRDRVLLVMTARPEDADGAPLLSSALGELTHDDRVTELSLPPLSRADTLALVRALTSSRTERAAIVPLGDRLWTLSQGNPLVVVEALRAVRETSALGAATRLVVPERIRQIIAGRLARLGERSRQLARVAAVIGREFDFAVLQRAASLTEREAADGVEELVRRMVLHGDASRFDFTHDRVREVAYAELLAPQRRVLHGDVARALESVYTSALEPHLAALGAHYREAEIWDKAVFYLRAAGRQASARSSYREAVRQFEYALDALSRQPTSPATAALGIDVRLDLRNALDPLSEFERIRRHLETAESLATQIGDRQRLGWTLAPLTAALFHLGDHRAAMAAGERALRIAAALGDEGLRIATNFRLGMTLHTTGDYRRVIELLESTLPPPTGDASRDRYGMSGVASLVYRHWLACSYAELGDFATGFVRSHEGLAIAQNVDHPFSVAAVHNGLGYLAIRSGDVKRAVEALTIAVTLCRSTEMSLQRVWATAELGYAHALAGSHGEAARLLEEAIALADAAKMRGGQSLRLGWLAEARLLAGRRAEAERIAGEALALARRREERGHEAWILRALGAIAAHSGSARLRATVDARYAQSRALAQELGMRPLADQCRREVGEFYRRIGARVASPDR